MSYAMSASLQRAMFTRLAADAALDELVNGAIYDAAPAAPPDLFVAIGPERATARDDATGRGSVHQIEVTVVTKRNGYSAAKSAAAAVAHALDDSALPLDRGRVVSIRFVRARARRDEGEGTRRIDLWFRVRLDADAD